MRDHEHLPATHRSNALVLACTLAALTPAAPAVPTITAVPIIQNESTVLATALSYDGSTVAGYSYNSTTTFTWSGAGAPTILQLPSNWSYDVPRAMNADGTALTGYGALGNPLSVQASRWTQAGGWQSLGSLGGTEAYGNAISADGLVVAGDGLLPSTTISLAYRWTPGGGMVTLPLGAGNTSAYATAMNQTGTVIVGATAPGPRAMRWTQIGGTENIGAVAGDTNSYAYAVNSDGSRICGTSGTTSCPRGFYWVEGQGMTPIGPVPGFSRVSADRMTPDGGAVCVNMSYQCGSSTIFDRAAIWTQSRGMVELHQYLAEQGLNTGGWILNSIVGVSNDGTVIAGNGNLGGWGRGYVIRGLNPICGPWIASQPPANVTACSTGVTGINVDAYSPFVPGHVTFQWHRQYIQGDGEANRIPLTNGFTAAGGYIDGATTPYLQLYGLQPGDAGQYLCLVTAGCGSVWTIVVNVQVLTGPPAIQTAPGNVTKCAAKTASFSATAGTAARSPFTVVWKKGNTPINLSDPRFNVTTSAGGITSTLTISNLKMSDTGAGAAGYTCEFTNPCGTTPTAPASLTVLPDLDGGGTINTSDLLVVLGNFGYSVPPWTNGDLNGDGVVNTADLTMVLGLMGTTCI